MFICSYDCTNLVLLDNNNSNNYRLSFLCITSNISIIIVIYLISTMLIILNKRITIG